MSRRTSRSTSYTSGVSPVGPFRAKVVGVSGGLASIQIPRLGLNNVYEDVPYSGFVPSVDTDVWAFFIEGNPSRPMIIVSAEDSQSDINEIVAGTNLNGGGTGGSITLNLDDDITLSTVTAVGFYGDLHGAIHLLVKNVSGGSLTKGTPVYATGAVGASGAVEVQASLAGTGSTMPAMGLLDQDLANNGEGHVVVSGVLESIDTATPGYSVGDELYVAVSGGLTTTRPTGSSELVQKIGKVIRVQQNTGEILVQGAGRTNDVPNSFSTSGDVTVGGDLTVNGTTVTLNTETLTVEDNIIVLNSNVTGTPSLNAGIEIERGSSSNVSFLWDESADAWSIGAVDFVVDTTTLFVDASEGRVGIGTTSPTYKLDVNGAINVSGDVNFNNNALVTSNVSSTNIDHIWHDETNNAWNFVSDSTYKAAGNSALNAATLNVTTVNLSTSVHLTNVDADGSMRVQGDNGYIDIGPKNATYCHIYTDRGSFYFNKATLYANSTSNVIWHAGNDGSGSGLDADTVDTLHASSFIRSDTSDTATGTHTFQNLRLSSQPLTTYGSGVSATPAYYIGQTAGSNDGWRIYGEGGSNAAGLVLETIDDQTEFIKMRFKKTYSPYTATENTFTPSNAYISSSLQAYSIQGHSNVAGTGNASYHPSGIYSTGTNWLYGPIITNNNYIAAGSGSISTSGALNADGNIFIRNGSPTIYLRDTNNRSGMIHQNSNIFYVLRGSGNDSTTWQSTQGEWPLVVRVDNNEVVAGGQVRVPNMDGTGSYNTVRYNTSNGHLMQFTSLAEYKTDVVEINGVLGSLNERSLLHDLRPILFHENQETATTRGEYIPGFIAEEVHEVAPELTYYDKNGELISYSPEALVPHLVAEIQRLNGMVEELYQTAHPDWTPPQPRPSNRGDDEKAVFDAGAAYTVANPVVIPPPNLPMEPEEPTE